MLEFDTGPENMTDWNRGIVCAARSRCQRARRWSAPLRSRHEQPASHANDRWRNAGIGLLPDGRREDTGSQLPADIRNNPDRSRISLGKRHQAFGLVSAQGVAYGPAMAETRYLIGLGSNRFCGGPPRRVIARAVERLAAKGVEIVKHSAIVATPPLGPGTRHYANAAVEIETDLSPSGLLELCTAIESDFGRRPGRRWGDRVIDIDLLFWSGGCWADPGLTLPHPALTTRDFVLAPLARIASEWRHPVSGRTVRHLHHHLRRNMPVDRSSSRP